MQIIRLFFLLLFVSFLLLSSCTKKEEKKTGSINMKETKESIGMEEEKRLGQSKQLGKQFVEGLQKELKKAIKTKGVHGAVSVCKDISSTSEADFEKKDPDILSFRRISLKVRNIESHIPTAAEKEWLITAALALANNKKAKPGFLKEKDKLTVLLPIVIKKDVCLKCHGDKNTFSQELTAALSKNYPNDKAFGFKKGDLRGALSVEWKRN